MSDNKDQITNLNTIQLDGESSIIGAETVLVLVRDASGNILECSGTVKPTDAGAGYAKGCIFIHTDGSAGTILYVNDGTATSCAFSAVPTASGSTATSVTVANEASDTSCYPLFATAATGDLGVKTNTGLTFNSSTGMLTATGFTGALTGAVTASTLSVSGAATLNGTVGLGNAVADVITTTGTLLVRQVTDADMDASAGTAGEIVFNLADTKFYGCTVTGATATWVALH